MEFFQPNVSLFPSDFLRAGMNNLPVEAVGPSPP